MKFWRNLESTWQKMAYGTGWSPLHLLSPLLIPVSWIYGRAAAQHREFYRRGVLKSEAVSLPVISVGNLTVGGVGKTPFIIFLAQWLKNHGFHPAILMRGYRRESKQPFILLPELFDANQIPFYGDEAALLSLSTGCPIGISANRVEMARRIQQSMPCDIFLMDDGFQHRALQRKMDIVLLDGPNPIGNGFCLPFGPLREPPRALRDASAILFRGEPNMQSVEPWIRDIPQFEGWFEWQGLIPLNAWRARRMNELVPTFDFVRKEVSLLSGIGSPKRFEEQASYYGFQILRHFRYPDHHWFTPNEILNAAHETAPHPILITEKDAVRLLPLIKNFTVPHSRIHVVRAHWTLQNLPQFTHWLEQCMSF